ncbi:MAG: hypothetical protein H6716_06900 [Polyangiaceae bacterium]|nr:hypothetical protein [Polyangiaceae bacterium]
MFIVLLKFAKREAAASHMAAHNAWIDQGLADGAFQLIGTLQPKLGGAIVVHGESREALELRLAADPFVEHGVVSTEILEIAPNRAADRFQFLLS